MSLVTTRETATSFCPGQADCSHLPALQDGDPERLEAALDALVERGTVVREQVAGVDACYLRKAVGGGNLRLPAAEWSACGHRRHQPSGGQDAGGD